MKRYNISETARILNISQGLLRHYEELHLITPMRGDNGYRYFQVNDIDILLGIRRFRNMTFSLDEMDKLIHRGSADDVSDLFSQKIHELEEDILWRKFLIQTMKLVDKELKQLPKSVGSYRRMRSPEALRIHSRLNDTFFMEELNENSLRWVKYLPVVAISPEFPLMAIETKKEEVGFGFMVPLRYAAPLKLDQTPGAIHYPSGPCISTVIFSRGKNKISSANLKGALEYLKRNHFKPDGDPWGITLGNFHKDGEVHRFHRVFLPIKK